MQTQEPSFWLLNGATGWRTAYSADVAVGAQAGIRLAEDPHGPLALDGAPLSLGQLTLPQGLALNGQGILYLLDAPTRTVKRFDPQRQSFVPLPAVGGEGSEARQFVNPRALACAGRNLYVVDPGNEQVQVFDTHSLALRHLWTAAELDWTPVDAATHAGQVYLLDQRHGRVYVHRPGSDDLRKLIDQPVAKQRWSRLAVDRAGKLYLLNATGAQPQLAVYDQAGHFVERVTVAGNIRDRFEPPPVRLDHRGRFCLPSSLAAECNRQAPQPAAPLENPMALCPPWSTPGGLVFTLSGERVPGDKPPVALGPRPYQTGGVWISQALDSRIYHCQWHRVELELAALPPGAQVIVSTLTDENLLTDAQIRGLAASKSQRWETRFTLTGAMQQPPQGRPTLQRHEFLVQSQLGRYLWVRVQFHGDGYTTPVVHSLRLHYPRQSYLEFLPRLFGDDQESGWFLERYLSIIQTEWDGMERQIAEISRYFDPRAVPESHLAYLAQWLAAPLEGAWDTQQQRNLLQALPSIQFEQLALSCQNQHCFRTEDKTCQTHTRIFARRGTLGSVRQYLQVYIQNITGLDPAQQRDYPQFVEGFRERQFIQLANQQAANAAQHLPLWGAAVVSRLQVDVFAQEGEVRLVSTGDPEYDFFQHYAHRFRVFLPAAWVRTVQQEHMLRRALDAAKPAHTDYDLCLVEPRFQVGLQSTVGLDTILGPLPAVHLPYQVADKNTNPGGATLAKQRSCLIPAEKAPPPGLTPSPRLGYDSVINGDPTQAPGTHLRPGAYVGIETVLL